MQESLLRSRIGFGVALLTQGRAVDDASYRLVLLTQTNVHRELAVTVDELLSTIERVNAPEALPVLPLLVGHGLHVWW